MNKTIAIGIAGVQWWDRLEAARRIRQDQRLGLNSHRKATESATNAR
jgi:hypothetical protein